MEILWHFPHETFRLAKDSGARFVRLDFFSDHMIAEGGTRVQINPPDLIAFQKSINAEDILLLTDIQVKYAEMMDSSITITPSASTAEAASTNAVEVSGKASGPSQ